MTPDEEIEELKAVNIADVKAFYKDFYGASNAELSVVGDFDPVSSNLSASSFEEDATFFAFAIAAPQNIAKVDSAFKEEMARALRDTFTQQEVDADRDVWLQSRQVGRAEDASLCSMINNRALYGRTLAWDQSLEDKVKALTPDDVLQAMKRNIDPAALVSIKAGDFKKATATGAL
jgi:zinc protease